MNWLNKMERKFGRYAINNLTMYLIGAYVVGYGIDLFLPDLFQWLVLNPILIMQGQVWRIISWVLVPPSGNPLTILIMLIFYYSVGRALERSWGAFRYNIYIFSGLLFTVAGSFVMWAYYAVTVKKAAMVAMNVTVYCMFFSTYYINMSIFLAFAAMFPDMEVLLYFIIPLKVKWLGIAYAVLLVWDMLRGNVAIRIVIIASLLNFILFFFSGRNMKTYSPNEQLRKRKYTKQVERPKLQYGNGASDRCAVCGRTELDNPDLEFRFCSKCKGNYEYCNEHLFTHEHVKGL